jgi:hypothetical protein
MSTPAHDPECYALARYFLAHHPPNEAEAISLAQHIQDAVEDWFAALPTPGTMAELIQRGQVQP